MSTFLLEAGLTLIVFVFPALPLPLSSAVCPHCPAVSDLHPLQNRIYKDGSSYSSES